MSDSQQQPRIGNFQTQRLLGIGSGGRVWLAQSPEGRLVALKVAEDPLQRARLRREVAALQVLSHRYVVGLVDSEPQGSWLATEYVQGSTLAHWGTQRTQPERIEVCARLAEAVAHLHDCGLVHGDLKPSNVMVDGYGAPRLIDLGTAQPAEHPARDEGFNGTLGYVGPELLSGASPSRASDVYSLGALVYTLLTHRAPFRSADPAALAFLPLSSFPEPPSSLVPKLPKAMDDLVLQMLTRTPERRPRSQGLSGRLRRALRSPISLPVVGMSRERATLRRALAASMDGACQVIVLHGGDGSGRRTLIQENIALARREGMPVLQGPGDDPRELIEQLKGLRGKGQGALVHCQAGSRAVLEFSARVLAEQLPVLVLIRSERPLMPLTNLGARHLSPSPLQLPHVRLLLSSADQNLERAGEIHERTRGRPGAVVGYLQPPSRGASGLNPQQIELLRITASEAVELPVLAQMLEIGEHELLDLAEPLLDRGLLVEVNDGLSLKAH
ncbi:MAG: serine/threonine-protein kinase [Myxococcota bacterium]|nr:serine/threonine-protein kinase [Myxococcota bacterium]